MFAWIQFVRCQRRLCRHLHLKRKNAEMLLSWHPSTAASTQHSAVINSQQKRLYGALKGTVINFEMLLNEADVGHFSS